MKTINKEKVKAAIAASSHKWFRGSYEYALSGMFDYYTNWSLYSKSEVIEKFYERIETNFNMIADYTTFKGVDVYDEVIEDVVVESDVTPVVNHTITFTSPINLEYSCTPVMTNLSNETESTIEIHTEADGSGWFEWDIEELELTESGCLEFEGNRLVGYDGVFELPAQLMDYLDSVGFITEDCR